MSKVKQNMPTAPGVLQPKTPPAPRTVPVAAAAPGVSQSSAAATSPSTSPLPGGPGPAQTYVLGPGDVGRTAIQFGNRNYILLDHIVCLRRTRTARERAV